MNHAYPLNECVNTGISGYGLLPTDYAFHKYACNEAGDVVTRTAYGSDAECSDANAADSIAYNAAVPGVDRDDIAIFDCSGEAGYVVAKSYKNDETCCVSTDTDPVVIKAATGVCFDFGDGNYSMFVHMFSSSFATNR